MTRLTIDFPDKSIFFSYELSIRICDENYFGHLGHDSLVTMLHEARSQLFTANGFREDDTEGCSCIVTELAVSYRSEAHYPQMLKVDLALGDMETYGCEIYYRVTEKNSNLLVAQAKTGHVFFEGRKPVLQKVPKAFKVMCDVA